MHKYLCSIIVVALSLTVIQANAGSTPSPTLRSHINAALQKKTFLNYKNITPTKNQQQKAEKPLCEYASQEECYQLDPRCNTGNGHHWLCAVCSDGNSWKCVPL